MIKTNGMWWIAAFILISLLVWISYHAGNDAEKYVNFRHGEMAIARADGTRADFHVEIAATPLQQERGLMFRTSLDANAGMLFVWPSERPVSMWMKDTVLPLDMLFVKEDGLIVKIAARAVPYDLSVISSGEPVRAVIEIGGGEAERQNIKTGDRVVLPVL